MLKKLLPLLFFSLLCVGIQAQEDNKEEKSPLTEQTFMELKFRNIGPGFASGRIADIAVHPENDNVWYVAVGSGGVWVTRNAGITWKPIFDKYSSYSTGCITIDSNNPNIIWLGTGENVGGRHVGYGDGIYCSKDGGKSWKNMGLKASEHISEIIVHPENSNVIWVAVQGPLWNKGGERGFYKSVDGGATWKKTLGDEEWTGVTDIAMDPRNPDLLYAATWQRHRTVAAYMGGGPKSGIHRSDDGGETWTELNRGLPSGNKGKIGIAISPQQPDIIYAAVELDRTRGAVYKSMDSGASWTKQSNTVSGGTGPHYYQELYASPHHFDRIYLMNVRILVSDDGGKNFSTMKETNKHSDNHAMAFHSDDPDYLLIGCDGGIYESFDHAQNWRYFDNLPVTQYYKVAVDDAKPFYNIYGGTQDNGSQGGPSRTDKRAGIRNADWYQTLFADGHQSATEPGNPDIIYAETQQGGLHRVDVTTGDQVNIQPQPREGEPFERFNWDAPILVSPHFPQRLYFASYRVWRSDNRGDSWEPISEDLTRNEERITLPIMGGQQSWDSPWDVGAMSNYNTITSLAESPLQEGLIYAGTDDGIIQITEDGGQNWRKIMVSELLGVPERAFVNDIRADLHDANTVYVALDNHKEGDYTPYLFKSSDRGQSWTSIAANLPDRHLVWRTVQDHIKPNLMFAATEFGIFFTPDGGGQWIELRGGVPTISFRDITIQRRENDLVAASFGRGFFVLDDYSALREITEESLEKEAMLFDTRRAWWFNPRSTEIDPGANFWTADNPPHGAVFTYYLKESATSMAAERKKEEARLKKEGKDIPFPGWEALNAEMEEEADKVVFTIKDSDGEVVRKLEAPVRKGIHRIVWDMTHAPAGPVSVRSRKNSSGLPATPGTYTVSMSLSQNGQATPLADPKTFEMKRLYPGALEPMDDEAIAAFREDVEDLSSKMGMMNTIMNESVNRVKAMETALARAATEPGEMDEKLFQVKKRMMALNKKMNGRDVRSEIGERTNLTASSRMWTAYRGLRSTHGPTATQKVSLELAKKEIAQIETELMEIKQTVIPAMEKELMNIGAPWIEGGVLPGKN